MPDGIDPPSRLPAAPPAPVPGERADPQRRDQKRRRDRRQAGHAAAIPAPDREAIDDPSEGDAAPDAKGSHIDIVA